MLLLLLLSFKYAEQFPNALFSHEILIKIKKILLKLKRKLEDISSTKLKKNKKKPRVIIQIQGSDLIFLCAPLCGASFDKVVFGFD